MRGRRAAVLVTVSALAVTLSGCSASGSDFDTSCQDLPPVLNSTNSDVQALLADLTPTAAAGVVNDAARLDLEHVRSDADKIRAQAAKAVGDYQVHQNSLADKMNALAVAARTLTDVEAFKSAGNAYSDARDAVFAECHFKKV